MTRVAARAAWRWGATVLTALTVVWALFLAAGPASAATAPAAENRIRASSIAAQTLDRPPQGVSADQRLGNSLPEPGIVVATGVAANTGFPRMSSTFGSRDKAIENMTKWSDRHPQEGYLDVIGHGSPDGLAGMSAAELAAKLRPGLGGRNVRLLSCQTGCPSGSFGQDLANELRVRVQAPTTDIGASGSGKTFDFYDGGEWRWFDPQG